MIVTQHSGAGKANQYFLRGFNLDHGTDFATYVAGMPVNLRTHAHGQGYMAQFPDPRAHRARRYDNSVKSKSTTLFNTQVTYKLDSKTRLRFDVFNIFNRKADDIAYYYTSRLPGEPAEGVNDIHFHPRKPLVPAALLYAF